MTYKPNQQIMMHLEQVATLIKNGRYLQAQLICNDLLKLQPEDVNVLHMTGLVAVELKEYEKAEKLFIKATELVPEFTQAFYNLGNLYRKAGLLKKAIVPLQKAIALDKTFMPSYKAIGDAYFKMNLSAEALHYYEQALEINEDVDILCKMGRTYSTVGDLKKADACYRKAISINANCPSAYVGLSRSFQTKFTEEEVATIEALLAKAPKDDAKISLHYALYKAYADIGINDKSFYHLHAGSTLKRSTINYSSEKNKLLTDRLIRTFTEDFFNERKDFGYSDASPIFILSMPRAGSTLTEQILSSHSEVFGAGELPNVIMVAQSSAGLRDVGNDFIERIPNFTLEDSSKLGQFYIDLCEKWRSQKTRFFTDKLPTNFSLVGFIGLILPNAKIIHVHRDPIDTCFGCYKVNFSGDLNFAYNLKELGEYYCDYWRLMEHWNKVLPGKIYNLSYEQLVNNQEEETRKLLDYCGLEWEEQCLRFYETERTVRTASAAQVRKPISTEGIGRWKEYEKHLAPLIEALDPVLKQ